MERASTERNSHPVAAFPYDAACQPQIIILDDQVEAFFKGQDADGVRKLDCCPGCGNVSHRARIFIAAILGDSSFLDSIARGDPGFGHDEMNSAKYRGCYHADIKFSRMGRAGMAIVFRRQEVRQFAIGVAFEDLLLDRLPSPSVAKRIAKRPPAGAASMVAVLRPLFTAGYCCCRSCRRMNYCR